MDASDVSKLHHLYNTKTSLAASLRQTETEIAELERSLMARMFEEGISAIGDSMHVASLKNKTVYRVFDWEKLYERIVTTREFDLLHRRLSLTAAAERFKNDDPIGGVEEHTFPELILTPRN